MDGKRKVEKKAKGMNGLGEKRDEKGNERKKYTKKMDVRVLPFA